MVEDAFLYLAGFRNLHSQTADVGDADMVTMHSIRAQNR